MLVGAQVGHQLLAHAALLRTLAQPPELDDSHARERAFPSREPVINNSERAADRDGQHATSA